MNGIVFSGEVASFLHGLSPITHERNKTITHRKNKKVSNNQNSLGIHMEFLVTFSAAQKYYTT
jgi:hypothetical protein